MCIRMGSFFHQVRPLEQVMIILRTSVDSIPIPRHYQQVQRYGLPLSSDLASLTSSNLYYARVQAI